MTKWRSSDPEVYAPFAGRKPVEPCGKVHVSIWRFDHDATALWSVLGFLAWKERQRDQHVPDLLPLVTVDETRAELAYAGKKLSRRSVRRVLKRLECLGIIERHSGGAR